MKYVLVSGGVISGVGKGIIYVSSIKIDPYLNVDAGTMNPKEHGECFVLDDGGEVDLDLGNYERYLNINLTRENNITTGKIYKHVIERERRGDYLGRTVQVVPHITDAILEWIERVSRISVDDTKEEPDVCVIELGGTVGDIESMPFVEALTQLRSRAGRGNFAQIHVSYVPVINGEQKTKPTQHAVRAVRSAGLIPDLIACRCEKPLEPSALQKIARACQVDVEQILAVRDMPSIYQVPVLLEEQGLITVLRDFLKLGPVEVSPSMVQKGKHIWSQWKSLTMPNQQFYDLVEIAMVGKYVEFQDSYLSVIKALEHSAMRCRRKLVIKWVDSEQLESHYRDSDPAKYHKAWHDVCTADGVLVPGGFGTRGTEGMVLAANWARENKRPYLGICLGMQIAVIEYARNVCGMTNATSEEFQKEGPDDHVIIFMPEIDKTTMGGTMRLGRRATHFQPGSEWSKLRALYGGHDSVDERHRHRYEVNPKYIDRLEEAGLTFIGKDDQNVRMEIVELKDHPYYVGVQYHPEFLSKVLDPSKPLLGLVAASSGILEEITRQQNMLVKGKSLANGVNGVNGVNGTHDF
ncbi:CTP synthase [Verruconis gallopava]|uniref:CTP synthase n=1 Tax=Verruconis gallopava TaxID=253628 RepID=A0A0D2ATC1_9PEZI|nr:CTP synthase [Verruconis gallopava]KIW02394.1 CTP synthase [Verruconis gallopava]